MIKISDAKTYLKKTKDLDGKTFTMIAKRKGDNRPVFKPIAVKANFFVRREESAVLIDFFFFSNFCKIMVSMKFH